jgi:hypothetical protein
VRNPGRREGTVCHSKHLNWRCRSGHSQWTACVLAEPCLFTCCLFNDTLNRWHYIASN